MRFGYFDDKNREYVITTPKTPYPWINYLGSENFFALVSHRAGGYCFYRDARLRRLMRYRYNNVPTDVGGRYFYIKDGDEVWNPSFAPTNTALDAFECRHGLGYTRITGERKGVRASLLMLVPTGHTAEIHQLTLKNTSEQAKSLKVFSLIEWCLWNAYDDMTNYQRNFSTGEVEVERNGATFISMRSKYKSDPEWHKVDVYLKGGKPPVFKYHRLWAQADIAIANASYGWLFPDDKSASAGSAVAGEGGAPSKAAHKGTGRSHSSRSKKQK